MRASIDFSPFYRSSVGFDRIFNLLENAAHPQNSDNWPPYDIAKIGEDSYRVAIAVAGFSEDELTITHEPNMLVVNGAKSDNEEVQYLHHGLALRPFGLRFELADHVIVEGAKLENGLLVIDLKKELPEEMKPRRIAINAEQSKKAAPKRIEGNVAA
ncbi:Hsp20 family protein [Nitratireductor luteus]|uniref:Hsp20 family protein n=1 Tax=Nitratireductor luteus TaxID=2976980 RepID=UPI00223F7767|nr:Hsp20 family protein [Nitratireductor luteus]